MRELMRSDGALLDKGLGQATHVVMVGEQQDLGLLAECHQALQGGPGALIIELDQDIIGDEGDGLGSTFQIALDGRQTQRQVELIGCARAHPCHVDALVGATCGPQPRQHRLAPVVLAYLQAAKGATGERAEVRRCTPEGGPLVALAADVHGGPEQRHDEIFCLLQHTGRSVAQPVMNLFGIGSTCDIELQLRPARHIQRPVFQGDRPVRGHGDQFAALAALLADVPALGVARKDDATRTAGTDHLPGVHMAQRPILVAPVPQSSDGTGSIVAMSRAAIEGGVQDADVEISPARGWIPRGQIFGHRTGGEALAMEDHVKPLVVQRLRLICGE